MDCERALRRDLRRPRRRRTPTSILTQMMGMPALKRTASSSRWLCSEGRDGLQAARRGRARRRARARGRAPLRPGRSGPADQGVGRRSAGARRANGRGSRSVRSSQDALNDRSRRSGRPWVCALHHDDAARPRDCARLRGPTSPEARRNERRARAALSGADAASSVEPRIHRIERSSASLPRPLHRISATRPVPPSPLDAALAEPSAPLLVAEDDDVLAALEHDLEVAPLRPAPPSTSGRRRATPRARPRPPDGSPAAASRRSAPRRAPACGSFSRRAVRAARAASGIRDHGATSTTVQPRPQPVLARTWRRPSLRRRLRARPRPPDELELLPRRLRQLDQLEPESSDGCGQLRELRPERRRSRRAPPSARAASPSAATSRRRRAAPRARPCGRPPARSGRASSRSSSAAERAPEGQLVADRLRELEPLDDLRRRAPPQHPPRRARLSPGSRRAGRPAPIVRRRRPPGARQAVRSSHPELARSSSRRRSRAEAASSGSGARNSRVCVVGDDERLARARDVGRGERREAPLGSAVRASQPDPTERERALERRSSPP